jgi:hypothetical protein
MPFVYFIHEDNHTDVFKIGKTELHVSDRLAQLQTGNPRKLIVYRWIEVEDHSATEEYLHAKHVESHIRGEWYKISREVVDDECGIICSLGGITKKYNGGDKLGADPKEVITSEMYPTWTPEDRVKVQEERVRTGRYRGKKAPQQAEVAREARIQKWVSDTYVGFSDE